ncbi:MAG TPA: PQQ-dependent sugar dehydrogenase [Longimicrobium sp.]|nr:PQQ-dependent sugar dehydrogenase [Longimicrobium sp.]
MKRIAALLLLAAAACNGSTDGTPPPPVNGIRLVEVARGFDQPVYVTSPPGDARLFVVEQTGRIRIIQNGTVVSTPFLDVTAKITAGGEQGLLSVAFHPQYATNGFFYVYYTDRNSDVRIERYHAAGTSNTADPASGQTVLVVPHPFSNHNGGLLMFGPDGKLYAGLGDGGGGGDPQGNGQNTATLLGKILRLDVDAAQPYAIPANNPFVGQTGKRGEIWITGVRNPWRYAFDRDAGLLYVADVGQSQWEEINVLPAGTGGQNLGWNLMEGAHCYNASNCVQQGLTLPAHEYSHSDGCSITGGFVYRGSAIPGLRGHYFYSDYCEGWVRSFRWTGSAVADAREWEVGDIGNVSSFGEDAARELYLTTSGGMVLKMVPAQS